MLFRHATHWDARRAGTALLVLLQIAASVALSPADALMDRAGTGSSAHVEVPGSEDCPASHTHLFCQVMRSLGEAGAARRIDVAEMPAPLAPYPVARSGDVGVGDRAFLISSVIPRGPPSV